MSALNVVFAILLQTSAAVPSPTSPISPISPTMSVVVGLLNGQKLAIDHPQFTGFIETRPSGDAILIYKQKDFRGELKLNSVQRIDFGYKKGKPFPLSVTLKNGQKMTMESDRRTFVIVKGATDTGSVTVNHPDPPMPLVELRTTAPNRKSKLTIQYLEFHARIVMGGLAMVEGAAWSATPPRAPPLSDYTVSREGMY